MNLTQDELAEKLGVSRQSVSKWETGAAYPEPNTLLQLSKILGVSCDCLLDDETELPPKESEGTASGETSDAQKSQAASSFDWLPGFIKNAFMKFGWIYGVYVAVGGFFFTFIGIIAKVMSRAMVNGFTDSSLTQFSPLFSDDFGSTLIADPGLFTDSQLGDIFEGSYNQPKIFNPVDVFATFIIIFGVIVMAAGVFLAIYLKKYGDSHNSK